MAQSSKIAILEDDADRIDEMKRRISTCLQECEVVVFDNAPDMIKWLRGHLEEVRLICLDHDLGPNRDRNGETFDPGTGRDVADYLACRAPVCPVLIHTTNSMAAPGMVLVLSDSGWAHSRVVPYNDLEWIRSSWIVDVKNLLEA